jgi:Family of unknown function (DUF5906)
LDFSIEIFFMRPTKTSAIKAFLMAYAPPDLAGLYDHDMECQVTVAKDNGDRIEGDFKGKHWQGYSDGLQTWKPIRIPLNAMSEPTYEDVPMAFDLSDHAEGIGMTGWDWKNKLSRWVAFDFDAISGHSDKHQKKLSDVELQKIRDLVSCIPWVTIRKSTGGRGLHVYVFVEPTTTNNHTEHAALARAILSQLSGMAGFEFQMKVDTCGGNMWVWHRKLKNAPEGLLLLKPGVELAKAPANWKDYISVVTGRRQRNLPWFIETQSQSNEGIDELFEELTGQRLRTVLDSEHKKIMDWLRDNYPNAVWWDAEHHMLVTHTKLLKECHEALNLRGKFETNAIGTEKGYDHNCFAFPITRGGWSIRRYSLGTEEHAFWEQDGRGWTCCFFNREPDLGSASRIYEGIEKPNGGGYHFASVEMAQKAALLLGANLNLPNYVLGKKATLKMDKTGRLAVTVDRDPDTAPIPGWICEKSKFTRLFPIKNAGPAEPEVMRLDEEVRHMITDTGEDCGWVIRSEKIWHEEPYQNVKAYLGSLGYKPNEVTNIMGGSIAQCWRIVNKPFEQEYPANREWNRRAAQFMYKPTINRDNLKYPTWLSILKHCGAGLDDAVKNNAWCKTSGILSGADYLKCWMAALFQRPKEPLPYLFFYSEEQNTGKSTVHEALSLLVTSGVVRADQALTSQSNFNGELENAVLCVVEETDLRKNVTAYNRIKDWVTSIHLPIHVKGRTPYQVPNTTHWIQCANTHLYCPVFSGDTRITMISVPELTDMIPRVQLRELLKAEAPDFMAEILNLEIPPSGDRLSLPALMTEDKASAAEANQSMLQMFIQEKCFFAPGHIVKFSAFCDLYYEWVDPNYKNEWSKIRIGRELPTKFPKGRLARDNGQFYIGNISFAEIPQAQYGNKYIITNGFLMEAPVVTSTEQSPSQPASDSQQRTV